MTYSLHRETTVRRPLAEVFDFFSHPENLEALTPPWLNFRIHTAQPIPMGRGAVIEYSIGVHGIPIRWRTIIESWNPPFEFVDVQSKGPYKLWRHTHRFEPRDGGTAIIDQVEYALPFGILGRIVHRLQVSSDLARIFDYRAEQVRKVFSS